MSRAAPVCCGCGHEITADLYRNVLGETWHELCWQREANLFFEDRALADDKALEGK